MTRKHNQLTDAMTTVTGWIGKLAEAQERMEAQTSETMARLAAAQERTEVQVAKTDAQLAETNEQLNIFINVVERYITENRNGHAGNGNAEPGPQNHGL